MFNLCLKEEMCPGEWKKAEVIPLLKQGKYQKLSESYRPVSLTSVCMKVMERMVVNILGSGYRMNV